MSVRFYYSPQTGQNTISEQTHFPMTINKAQGQTLKCAGIYLPSPVFFHSSCMWNFPDPLHLTTSLSPATEGYRHCTYDDRLVT
jgi:PIF1 helicase.